MPTRSQAEVRPGDDFRLPGLRAITRFAQPDAGRRSRARRPWSVAATAGARMGMRDGRAMGGGRPAGDWRGAGWQTAGHAASVIQGRRHAVGTRTAQLRRAITSGRPESAGEARSPPSVFGPCAQAPRRIAAPAATGRDAGD
jgi:hypothetical protein